MLRVRKSYVTVLIFFIVVVLHSPVYHQHIDDYHPETTKHNDNVAPHAPNDYSVNSHDSIIEPEYFTEKSHDTHYHLHFEKPFYRYSRIDKNKIKTISFQTLEAFNSLSPNTPALKKHLYAYYKPKHYSNHYAKTFSGLSPPIYST